MLNKKIKLPFDKKNSIKSFYLVIATLHLTRREYKGKIYVKNIRKNSCRIGKRIQIRIRKKFIPDPQHCCRSIFDLLSTNFKLQLGFANCVLVMYILPSTREKVNTLQIPFPLSPRKC
jgi:hypothetical protein